MDDEKWKIAKQAQKEYARGMDLLQTLYRLINEKHLTVEAAEKELRETKQATDEEIAEAKAGLEFSPPW